MASSVPPDGSIPAGESAARRRCLGLADVLVPLADVRKGAMDLAKEIAEQRAAALLSTRETMRPRFCRRRGGRDRA